MATVAGVVAIFMWGMLAVLTVNASDIPPFQLLTICFLVSALLIFVKRLVRNEPLTTPPKLTVAQWIATVGGLFGFHFCYFLAIRYAPAIEVSLIGYLWPLLFGVAVASPATRRFAIVGGLVGFIGCALLVTGGESLGVNIEHASGYALALACALIWAAYSWYMGDATTQVEDIGWVCGAVAVFALVVHIAIEDTVLNLPASAWVSALLLGLGPVGGAFYLWDIGVKFGNRSLLASLSFATPVISSIALAMFGVNPLTATIAIAVALIVSGALVSNFLPRVLGVSRATS
ncbi:EamA family transporter [Alteromonas sp. KUL49]|uniref:DMT family transporter n=1 Tax=Alteromonas sp. KUL49 TaxID=2480798 RepID=UPI00102ED999|nr:EamA family transporter [Alteromonas sp. KUL49]TAP42494.1 EamA family transporter [Alteromonas sp. KUL49]GEA10119.1 membrane protein [Alteromonas sp. KUL49]